MEWLVIALVILFGLLIILLWTKLTVFVEYYHGNDNDHLTLNFRIWFGLIRFKKEIPLIKIDDDSPSLILKDENKIGNDKTTKKDVKKITKNEILKGISDAKKILQHIVHLHNIIRNFLSKVSIKKIEWHTLIGINDAATTGVVCGAIWAAKGSFIGILSNYMRLQDMPTMTVTPHFQHTVSQIKFKCMFQFRIGQAMLAGIKLIKFWKGGLPDFESKPLSLLTEKNSKSVT